MKSAKLRALRWTVNFLTPVEKSGKLPTFASQLIGINFPSDPGSVESILFVCKGNICRSAYAEHKLKKLLQKSKINKLSVSSAGVWTKDGKSADETAISTAMTRGVDLSRHLTSMVKLIDLEQADLILVMDSSHRIEISKLCKPALSKTYFLARFKKDTKASPIIRDPFGKSPEIFQRCFEEIDASLENLVDWLAQSES